MNAYGNGIKLWFYLRMNDVLEAGNEIIVDKFAESFRSFHLVF